MTMVVGTAEVNDVSRVSAARATVRRRESIVY